MLEWKPLTVGAGEADHYNLMEDEYVQTNRVLLLSVVGCIWMLHLK